MQNGWVIQQALSYALFTVTRERCLYIMPAHKTTMSCEQAHIEQMLAYSHVKYCSGLLVNNIALPCAKQLSLPSPPSHARDDVWTSSGHQNHISGRKCFTTKFGKKTIPFILYIFSLLHVHVFIFNIYKNSTDLSSFDICVAEMDIFWSKRNDWLLEVHFLWYFLHWLYNTRDSTQTHLSWTG